MITGRCVRCGHVGPVEADHPDGRHCGIPLWPEVTATLCSPCHLTKGRIDRAAGVEGGPVTVPRVLRRRAVWCTFLSTSGPAILIPAKVLADCGEVLAYIAQQIPPRLPMRLQR